jgi:hypothetical protein
MRIVCRKRSQGFLCLRTHSHAFFLSLPLFWLCLSSLPGILLMQMLGSLSMPEAPTPTKTPRSVSQCAQHSNPHKPCRMYVANAAHAKPSGTHSKLYRKGPPQVALQLESLNNPHNLLPRPLYLRAIPLRAANHLRLGECASPSILLSLREKKTSNPRDCHRRIR